MASRCATTELQNSAHPLVRCFDHRDAFNGTARVPGRSAYRTLELELRLSAGVGRRGGGARSRRAALAPGRITSRGLRDASTE
jgi:hypothetical protein